MITNTPQSLTAKERVRIAIILNGISLKKKFFYQKVLPSLAAAFNTDVFETHSKNDAVSLASKAVDKGYDILIAAGGDGTLNQVLNGVLLERENRTDLPVLGVFPIGSGDDFARTLKIPQNGLELCEQIKSFQVQKLDVGKIIYTNDERRPSLSYFINVADAGMGPEVVSRMTNSDRAFGSAIAYYTAILSTFFSYKPMSVKIKTPDWVWEGKLRTVAIGNGKFYGHGLCIAPDAKPDDGIFSSFVCGDVSVLEFIQYSGTLKSSKKIDHPKVSYASANHIELTSESPCRIEADGELLGFLPATIDIIPRAIKFLC
jgi:YegS/Rv2252/BmrU family lipid kinase